MEVRVNAAIVAEQLLPLFRQTDFADDRDESGCAHLLATARLHVSAWEGDRLVGFARSVTDGQYIALIVDVVVDEPFRGRGIGSAMLRRIAQELAEVEEILLGCEENMVPFYQKLGWARDDGAVMTYEGQAS